MVVVVLMAELAVVTGLVPEIATARVVLMVEIVMLTGVIAVAIVVATLVAVVVAMEVVEMVVVERDGEFGDGGGGGDSPGDCGRLWSWAAHLGYATIT